MENYEPIEVRGYYRSPSHMPIWEVIDKAGIWRQLGVTSARFEYSENPIEAEGALFDGTIDFISGNHITPYALVAKGKRIVDLALEGRAAGFNHLRGNHMLYLLRAGVGLDQVTWVELGDEGTETF